MPSRAPILCLLSCALSLAVVSLPMVSLPAQEGSPHRDPDPVQVATAIHAWIADFEGGRLGAKGLVRGDANLQPSYLALARRAGVLVDADEDRLTHLDVLQKLLFYGERSASADVAAALLDVAAAGLESSFLDRQALELREFGHWALMRTESPAVWFFLLRAAAGERVPLLDDLRGVGKPAADSDVTVGPARRVAALRLLGQRNLPVFRGTIEAALVDADPRVRLAAAEAFSPPWRIESMRRVSAALAKEAHPVVSQALVRLLATMLKAPPPECEAFDRQEFVVLAMRQFGRCGWRTDMDLLDLVEAYPRKQMIPQLIQALDLEVHSPDALVAAINQRASPRLRQRAGGLLRAMTGALIPPEDVAAWRQFWQQEHEHIVVPEQLAQSSPDGTRAEFFGVPVTGGSIAFLIDTSGSMGDAPANGPTTGPRRRGRDDTRLDAAKEQLVLAVQAMPPESQYVVLTFSDRAHAWTTTPIKPSRSSVRSLTELLSRLRAHGGTNLHDGLATALDWRGRGFGDNTTAKIDELFVLSDGEPTTGETQDEQTLLTMVREANRYAKVRIHTVFTGTGKGADLLQRLAEENGGVFVQR